MDAQLKKGILEPLVLALIGGGETYGYELSERISAIIGISETALYPVLKRLEAQACLETRTVEYRGRLRKYYALTEQGRESLANHVRELVELEKVIAVVTRGGGKNADGN